jgi:hypothetical protein
VLFLAFYVVKFVSRTPIHDEFSSALYLFNDVPLNVYWSQHNEHRIPLPRVLYFAAVRLAGKDFRGPPVLNVLLLTAAVAFFLHAMQMLRGSYSLADAALPLGLLSIGQYGNLLWGFQVQFIASTALTIVMVGFVASPGVVRSPGRLSGLGLCGVLLPMCGANGVAFAPGLALGLLIVGGLNLKSRVTRSGLVALFWGTAILAMCAAYFHGLVDPPHHQKAHGNLKDAVIGTVNLLGASFGPVVRWLPPQPYDGFTAFGILGTHLVAATGWLLIRGTFDSKRRAHAILLGGALVGFLGLAAGIAKGRAGLSNVLDPNRYVSLMLPMLAGVYAAWTAFGFSRLPRILAAVVAVCAIPNAIIGWNEAKPATLCAKRIEADVKDGLPLDFAADRNTALYPGEPAHRRSLLHLLRKNGIVPFCDAVPLPKFKEEDVPLRILKLDKAVEEDGSIRVTGEIGCVRFALPERRRVYGFRITYSAIPGSNPMLPSVMSWAPSGALPSSFSQGVINQIEPHEEPIETLVWVQTEVETLRLDLFGHGARVRIHKLTLLTTE